jgi:hypothetical protein
MWIELNVVKCPVCGHYVPHSQMEYDEETDIALCGLCIENRNIMPSDLVKSILASTYKSETIKAKRSVTL